MAEGPTGMLGDHPEEERLLERLVFFSDAVIAIAITVLILEIRVPGPDESVPAVLADNTGRFIAYFVSFWVIAILWRGHHRVFRYVVRYDGGLLWINLALLFCIVFLPYPTLVIGERPPDTASTVFYAGCNAVTGLCGTALVWYAFVHRDLDDGRLSQPLAYLYVARGLTTPLVFGASIPVAFAYPAGARFLWLLTIPFQTLMRRLAEPRLGRRGGVDG